MTRILRNYLQKKTANHLQKTISVKFAAHGQIQKPAKHLKDFLIAIHLTLPFESLRRSDRKLQITSPLAPKKIFSLTFAR